MKSKDKVELIKSSLSLRDIINHYGLNGDEKHGRIPCPFHHGNNRNAFSFNDNLYQCWNCGASGDLISFVMQYDGLNFNDALDRINDMFNLWHPGKPLSINQKKKIESERYKRKMQKIEKEQINHEYESVRDELNRIDANLLLFAPESDLNYFNDKFVEACHKISYQRYLAEITTKGESIG